MKRKLIPLLVAGFCVGCTATRTDQVVLTPAYESEIKITVEDSRELGHVLISKYWEQCVGDAPFFAHAHPVFYDKPADLKRLQSVAKELSESDAFYVIEQTIEKARSEFSTPGPIDICAFAGNPDSPLITQVLNGVSGLSPGPNKIILNLHPQNDWLHHLAYTVAHEYHHSAWFSRKFEYRNPWTLLQWIIHEGRADHFAERFSNTEVRKWWTKSLSPQAEQAVWSVMKPLLYNADMLTTSKYVFGDGQNVPWLAGYQIGYNIVAAFLAKNPNLTTEQWSLMGAEEIFLMSGYGESITTLAEP